MNYPSHQVPGRMRQGDPHLLRNTIIALLLLLVVGCGALLCWRLRSMAPAESAELAAMRASADNAYPVLAEALSLFPPKPAGLAIPEATQDRIQFDPMARRLGLSCPDTDPALLEYLAKCEPVVAKIREGLQKPYCVLPEGEAAPGSMVQLFSGASPLFRLSPLGALLGARAIHAQQQDPPDWVEAQACVADLIHLGVLLQNDGLFILGGIFVTETVAYLLPILDQMPPEILQSGIEQCREFEGQLRFTPETVDCILRIMDNVQVGETDALSKGLSFGFRTLMRLAAKRSSQGELHKALALPYPQFRLWLEQQRFSASDAGLTDFWFMAVSMCVEGTTLREASLKGLRVAMAVELFRKTNGRYPEALDDLSAVVSDPLPSDPFSGAPFVYRLDEAKGCLLYSVGPDGRDDGGDEDSDCLLVPAPAEEAPKAEAVSVQETQ